MKDDKKELCAIQISYEKATTSSNEYFRIEVKGESLEECMKFYRKVKKDLEKERR